MIPHYEYYKSIKSDFIACFRFVELDPKNYETFSIEFARIIMASCSEIDTVFRIFCDSISSTEKPNNICEYYTVVASKYPGFTNLKFDLFKYKLSVRPWENWSGTNSPTWWRAYNKLKHERELNFEKASLRNALYSLGGLFSLLLYYAAEKSGDTEVKFDFFDLPKLFFMERPDTGGGLYLPYNLP